MEELRALVGRERSLQEVSRTLHLWASGLASSQVGALQVTCSDETENECIEAFQRGFVQYLLPSLKFATQSAFRLANLGGRYEWGAAVLTADHFCANAGSVERSLLAAKVNAHVAVQRDAPGGEARFGVLQRYGRESACCAALSALLAGERAPHLDDLREAFRSEGKDRLRSLQEAGKVAAQLRPLYAAVVSARLQARKVVLDLQDAPAILPSLTLVLPCVTMNRPERDSEIVVGLYEIRPGDGAPEVSYTGLGDDPGTYEIRIDKGRFEISDDQSAHQRPGRDHRKMVGEMLRRASGGSPLGVHDERLGRVREDVAKNKHRNHHHARALLRIALPLLAEVAPVPAAILAFAQGATGIHHAFRVHRLAREMSGDEEARQILGELHQKIDRLDGERAEALIELLTEHYSGG